MRIISGTHKGRRLLRPDGAVTRPTTDKVKESLFNLLIHGLSYTFQTKKVLDLFSGSGALGVEALSRGASHVTFVETHRDALRAVQENTKPFPNKCIIDDDATTFITPIPHQYDLIFLDPPYGKNLLIPTLNHLVDKKYMAPGATLILEMDQKDVFETPSFCHINKEKVYRHTKLLFCTFNET